MNTRPESRGRRTTKWCAALAVAAFLVIGWSVPGALATDTDAGLIAKVRHYYDINKDRADRNHGQNWLRVLIAFGDRTHATLTAYTAAEARQSEAIWDGWRPIREELERLEAAQQQAEQGEDGQQSTQADPPILPENAVTVAEVQGWRNDPQWVSYKAHTDRWDRVLAALGVANGATPMTAAEAQAFADRGEPWVTRWGPVAETLAVLEALQTVQIVPPQQQDEPFGGFPTGATLGPGGTIPMRDVLHQEFSALADPVLTVGSDGTLTLNVPGRSFSKSVCLDPSKGCAAEAVKTPDGPLSSRFETFIQKPREEHWRDYGGYYGFKPQAGVLDGWTIMRFGDRTHRDDGTHWHTYGPKPRYDYRDTANWTEWSDPARTDSSLDVAYRGRGCAGSVGAGRCWYYVDRNGNGMPDANEKRTRRHPWANSRGYLEISTWGIVGYDYGFVPERVDNFRGDVTLKSDIRRWFIAAKHDGGEGYRAFGYWLEYDVFLDLPDLTNTSPDWPGFTRSVSYQTFAAGTDPATDVSGVSGTASYRGEAAGLMRWSEAAEERRHRRVRYSTFEGAPVSLSANFDSMRITGRIDLKDFYQRADGHLSPHLSLDRWREVGPKDLVVWAGIGNDGTFTNGGVALRSFGPAPVDTSEFKGRFYQPDGANAPGSAMGTFKAEGGGFGSGQYRLFGAFGADKQ